MAQFTIYQNTNSLTKKTYPYIVDVQYPLLDSLNTRLMIPLTAKTNYKDKIIKELNPTLKIRTVEYILLIQQIAAIRKENLGTIVGECSEIRQEIIYGIDFLITGF